MNKSERNGTIGAIIGGILGVSMPITLVTGNYLFVGLGLLVGFILIVGLFLGTK